MTALRATRYAKAKESELALRNLAKKLEETLEERDIKMRGTLHLKVRRKIDAIAKMRCAGLKDSQIAHVLQITQSTLSRIAALPEYQEKEQAIFTGIQTKFDEALSENIAGMRKYFAIGVPVAMQQVLDTIVNQKADLKVRLEAAREILDRDPKRTFAKASPSSPIPAELPPDILDSRSKEANTLRATVTSKLVN